MLTPFSTPKLSNSIQKYFFIQIHFGHETPRTTTKLLSNVQVLENDFLTVAHQRKEVRSDTSYNRAAKPTARGPNTARVNISYGPHQTFHYPNWNTTKTKLHDKKTREISRFWT